MKKILQLILLEIFLNSTFLRLFANAESFTQFNEDGQMKISCDGGGELFYEESEKIETPSKICWQVGKQQNCQDSKDEIFTGASPVVLSCDRKSAEVILPVSANYPVFFKYSFELRNQNIVFLGIRKTSETFDSGPKNFKKGLSSLKAGKFDEGFATLKLANDDGCLSLGCRPAEELARRQNLFLARKIGVEIGKIAQKLDREQKLETLLLLYKGYFLFCVDIGVMGSSHEKSLVDVVAKNATTDLEQPLNDWAFFLWKSKDYSSSQKLLETVLRLNPERAIAHLNIGDVFWDLGNKSEARLAYQQYAKRVNEKKWPRNLKERLR